MSNERDRISKLAARLRLLVWGLIGIAAALYLAARFQLVVGHVRIVPHEKPETVLPALTLARDLSVALLLGSLAQLAAMLGFVERGDRFSPAVTLRFRRFALLLLLASAIPLIVTPLTPLLASGGEQGPLQIPFNFRDIWVMLVAGVLFLVARLLDEARRIETDLDEIV